MDARYYQMLRQATQEEFYNSINDPEDELYDIIWDLFEKLVIEPAEIFDANFRDSNQFRYSINSLTVLEFFPSSDYFRKRLEPNPYEDDADAAGIHLQFFVLPSMSCLFAVGFQVWGASERQAFRNLWRSHRKLLSDLFRRIRPMISCKAPYPAVEHAATLDEALENYFMVRDPESFVALQYSFARADEADVAQNFMVAMAMLYHAMRAYCQDKRDRLEEYFSLMQRFYSGHIPELPAPLPCVEIVLAADAE
jgi:hypothetical protein